MCQPRFQTRGTTMIMANQRQALYTSRDLIDFADRMMDSSAFHTWKGSKENMGLYSQFDFACQRPPKFTNIFFIFTTSQDLAFFSSNTLSSQKAYFRLLLALACIVRLCISTPPKICQYFFHFYDFLGLSVFFPRQILCLPKKPISDSFNHLHAR